MNYSLAVSFSSRVHRGSNLLQRRFVMTQAKSQGKLLFLTSISLTFSRASSLEDYIVNCLRKYIHAWCLTWVFSREFPCWRLQHNWNLSGVVLPVFLVIFFRLTLWIFIWPWRSETDEMVPEGTADKYKYNKAFAVLPHISML